MLTTSLNTTAIPHYILRGDSVHTSAAIIANIVESTENPPHLVAIWRKPTDTPPAELTEFNLSLNTLEPGYELLRPIRINVRRIAKTNYVGRFAVINISASGESTARAISNIAALIVDMYDLFSAADWRKLGPEPRHQLQVLTSIIRKTK